MTNRIPSSPRSALRMRSSSPDLKEKASACTEAIPSSPPRSLSSSEQDDDDDNMVYIKPKRRISFDERVSVREFESHSWISVKDVEHYSPVGSRIRVPRVIVCDAPQEDANDLLLLPALPQQQPSLFEQEMRTILMVDPHDIFLNLFSKRWQQALPHIQVYKAHSSQEAWQLLRRQSFDIILTEERLCLFHRHQGSGSALLGQLRHSHAHSLLIGVSAHWQADHATMARSGADYCWPKAPAPTLTTDVLEDLMATLLRKRGKQELAKDFVLGRAASAASNQEDAADYRVGVAGKKDKQ